MVGGAFGSGGKVALEVPGVEGRPSCPGRISNPTFQGLTPPVGRGDLARSAVADTWLRDYMAPPNPTWG